MNLYTFVCVVSLYLRLFVYTACFFMFNVCMCVCLCAVTLLCVCPINFEQYPARSPSDYVTFHDSGIVDVVLRNNAPSI